MYLQNVPECPRMNLRASIFKIFLGGGMSLDPLLTHTLLYNAVHIILKLSSSAPPKRKILYEPLDIVTCIQMWGKGGGVERGREMERMEGGRVEGGKGRERGRDIVYSCIHFLFRSMCCM